LGFWRGGVSALKAILEASRAKLFLHVDFALLMRAQIFAGEVMRWMMKWGSGMMRIASRIT
jgi:hypothetical protein